MVIVTFQIKNKLGRAWFFQETFLLANTSIEIIIGMPFLTFSNANMQFAEKKLTWRSYTIKKTLPTIWKIELIDKKEFAKAALDEYIKAFVIHVSSLSLRSKIIIYLVWEAQIASLLAKNVAVLAKYSDFANMFSKKSPEVLSEHTEINKYVIKLENGKQPPYGPIYRLNPMELETLKTYIETNLANGFIWPSKSLAGAPILFVRKPNSSFQLCVDY